MTGGYFEKTFVLKSPIRLVQHTRFYVPITWKYKEFLLNNSALTDVIDWKKWRTYSFDAWVKVRNYI